ncbi:MAG: hypothetical protein LKI94_05730 [Sporolactobacillus sp.]|jgi:hypothetical protein|nr:hypothetical protein [Sporolactobacillus sp.]
MRVFAIAHTNIKELQNQINDFLTEHAGTEKIADIKFSSTKESIKDVVYSALIMYNE